MFNPMQSPNVGVGGETHKYKIHYEIFEVPNDELDGTEEYIDYATDRKSADSIFEEAVQYYTNVWLIECSEYGYEKVVRT